METNNVSLIKGMQVHLSGKVINQRVEDSCYGSIIHNTILSRTGIVCVRTGKVPVSYKNGVLLTEFYAIVKSVYNRKVYLDRATKHPKKGIDVVEI